jgi:hypothetical protein
MASFPNVHQLSSGTAHYLTIAIVLGAAYSLYLLIREALSPLSKIPGPFLASISQLPIIINDSRGQRTLWTDKLHRKYGPIVRIAPYEISITSKESIRKVYTGSHKSGYCTKGFIYSLFTQYGTKNLFSTLDYEDSVWRRRILAPCYSPSTILSRQVAHGSLWHLTEEFRKYIESEGAELTGFGKNVTTIDLVKACRYYSSDSITEHVVGNGTHALAGDRLSRQILDDITQRPGDRLTYWLMKLLNVYAARNRIRQAFRALIARFRSNKESPRQYSEWRGVRELKAFIFQRFSEWLTRIQSGYDPSALEPVAAHLATSVSSATVDTKDSGEKDALSADNDLKLHKLYPGLKAAASECADQFLAGIETVTDTLCYIILNLSTGEAQHIQTRLREEIINKSLHSTTIPTLENLNQLLEAPVLDAVVKETLRLCPANTASMHRVIPAEGKSLDGYFVPGGVVAGSSPYIINRDAEIFDPRHEFDVFTWHPERWLNREASEVSAMERRMCTFGSGERACIGKLYPALQSFLETLRFLC